MSTDQRFYTMTQSVSVYRFTKFIRYEILNHYGKVWYKINCITRHITCIDSTTLILHVLFDIYIDSIVSMYVI